jgi:hypothetical protein
MPAVVGGATVVVVEVVVVDDVVVVGDRIVVIAVVGDGVAIGASVAFEARGSVAPPARTHAAASTPSIRSVRTLLLDITPT